jgi:acetyltransferase-like isoleucine patch superfamily enzyme
VTIVPVLLDQRPAYLGGDTSVESLLLVPTAEGTLVGEIARALTLVTSHRPYVMPAFDADAEFEARVRTAWPDARALTSTSALSNMLASLEPSDRVLLVSPSRYPSAGIDFLALCTTIGDDGMVRHLLAFDAAPLGTRELARRGDDGRRIRRHFSPITWPFPVGVIATLVPVACLHAVPNLLIQSLDELRGALSARGIPSCDVPWHGESLDLTDEAAALTLMTRRVMATTSGRRQHLGASAAEASLRSPAAIVHASARFVGPVVVHAQAIVEADALIVGPAVIGSGARVARFAMVSQCLVLPATVVAETVTVRHRVVANPPAESPRGARRTRADEATRLAVRRVLEPILVAAALIVLAPLLVVVALVARVRSPRARSGGDRREGRDGQRFTWYRWVGLKCGSHVRMLGPLTIRGQGDIIGTDGTVGHRVVFIAFNQAKGPSSGSGGLPSAAGITIGDGAWVGASVTVLPGVTVSAGAFEAAGNVVTRSIPLNGRVRENPAKPLDVLVVQR